MPRGIKGYRWIETGIRVFMLENPIGTRHFLGCVSENTDGWTWRTHAGGNYQQGEASTFREAKHQVDRRNIPGLMVVR